LPPANPTGWFRFEEVPLTSTIFACAPPPTNPARGFRFEDSPLTSTIKIKALVTQGATASMILSAAPY
jgi:hypothetical protein